MLRTAKLMVMVLVSVSPFGVLSSFAKSSRVPNQVIRTVLKDACSSGCSEEQIAEYRRSIKTELHDLNADNAFELFVYIEHRDFCGIGFNCSFWIFQRRRNGYQLLSGGACGETCYEGIQGSREPRKNGNLLAQRWQGWK